MAQVSFSDNAVLHIRAVLATQPNVFPVVSISWLKGIVDNSRNFAGTITWQPVQPASWYAAIVDWGDFPDPTKRDRLLER